MELSPETTSLILEEMADPNTDIFKVSRAYGVPVTLIRELLPYQAPVSFKEKHGGLGRPSLQQYTVARTRAGYAWQMIDASAIRTARVNYDAGTHEMCTGRDGDWLILYCIPRRYTDRKRRPYFSRSAS